MVYPEQAPSQRVLHADVRPIAAFQLACAGLLREAGVRPQDTLVGLGDGAPWVAATLQLMGATVVLDVFHAVGYLDTVMEQLGWDGDLRQNERRAWLRGECDAAQWLNTYLPNDDRRQDWSEASCGATRYLLDRVDQMHYPSYRAQGWPIGSGQIEEANKSVIGHRMKRAGQYWFRDGAVGMAAIRARAPIQSPSRCLSRPCASSPSQPRISELHPRQVPRDRRAAQYILLKQTNEDRHHSWIEVAASAALSVFSGLLAARQSYRTAWNRGMRDREGICEVW